MEEGLVERRTRLWRDTWKGGATMGDEPHVRAWLSSNVQLLSAGSGITVQISAAHELHMCGSWQPFLGSPNQMVYLCKRLSLQNCIQIQTVLSILFCHRHFLPCQFPHPRHSSSWGPSFEAREPLELPPISHRACTQGSLQRPGSTRCHTHLANTEAPEFFLPCAILRALVPIPLFSSTRVPAATSSTLVVVAFVACQRSQFPSSLPSHLRSPRHRGTRWTLLLPLLRLGSPNHGQHNLRRTFCQPAPGAPS